jgi:transposase
MATHRLLLIDYCFPKPNQKGRPREHGSRELLHAIFYVVKRNELYAFKVLPRRWMVEPTFGWLGRYHWLDRDHERQAHTGEIMVHLAMTRLMLARLGK